MRRDKNRGLVAASPERRDGSRLKRRSSGCCYSEKQGFLIEAATESSGMNEEKLRSIFAASPDAITVTDLNGNVVECNQATLEMHRYASKKHVVGRSAFEFIAKRDRRRARENMVKVLKQGSMKTVEYTFLTKQGDEFSAELSASVVRDYSGKPIAFVAITKDITERKRMAKKLEQYSQRLERLVEKRTRNLKESEEHFRSVADYASEAIVTINAHGRIVFWNKAAKTIFGYSQNEVLGKFVTKLVPKGLRKNHQEGMGRILSGQSNLAGRALEFVGLRKDGSEFPLEFSFSAWKAKKEVFFTGIMRDIRERKKAEKALKLSEAKFRTLFENVPAGVYQTSPDGKIITANPMLVRMLGYDSLRELLTIDVGRDLYIEKEDRGTWQRELERKGELRNAELVLKRRDGQKLVVLENSHVVRDEQGKVLYYEGTLTDVTEKKLLEERLSALNRYSGKLNTANSLQEIYGLTLDVVERILGFEYALFTVIERGSLKAACQRGYPKPLLQELPLDGSKRGITVKTANTCRPMLVTNVKKCRDYVEGVPGICSELAVPIETEDRVIGVLDVQSRKVGAFSEQDTTLLQLLASHVATAISNLEKRKEIEKRSSQMALLMKCSAEMIRSTDLRHQLRKIAESIRKHGWRRVVIRAFREADMETSDPSDMVTAGLTREEKEYLWNNRVPGQVWRERLGPDYERFKIGEFYYLPWSDPWVRKRFSQGTVSSHLSSEQMVDWDPEDLLYAPLCLADGRVVGIVSIDDPIDGRRPTRSSLAPMELFLHQAAVAIENAYLFQELTNAKNKIREYADQLEMKVKQRTQELVEAQNKLLRAERLAAIGEISAMVGHDLRNPLTGIAGAAYYLKTKGGEKLDEKSREMLEIIEKDVEYSNKIVSDLLDYSREMHLEQRETTLKSVVGEALAFVHIPSSIKVLDSTQNEPKVEVDVGKLKRVFVNLVKNAVDAMPKGGTLRIRSRERDGQVDVSFADTGTGMSKEVLQRLWSPLFTTKAKGMGFGLAICKRIVEGHGGVISVESTAGKGTTFTVTIPIKAKTEGGACVWVNLPESLLSMMMKA